nr:MAG TPA: tail assembly protein [Caudoviricetes sp.]
MFRFYLANMLLPITPSKLSLKVKNMNKTVTLINEGEVNIIKTKGLREFSFEFLLPFTDYSFAAVSRAKKQKHYLDKLNQLKINKRPFQFVVKRPKGFKTNIKVTLEDLNITEDAQEGRDIKVSVTLKEYRHYGTKKVVFVQPPVSATGETKQEEKKEEAKITENRDTSTAQKPKTHIVKRGDTLWGLAKRYYGNGSLYPKIVSANPKIKNPNLIIDGWELVIP